MSKSVDDIRELICKIIKPLVAAKMHAEECGRSADYYEGGLYIAQTILGYIDGKGKNG